MITAIVLIVIFGGLFLAVLVACRVIWKGIDEGVYDDWLK